MVVKWRIISRIKFEEKHMIEKRNVVEIREGGQLFYTDWRDGAWAHENVSDNINKYLFEPCFFEEGLKLRDIFDLVAPKIDFFEDIMPSLYMSELLTESWTVCSLPKDESESLILLLSRCVEHDKEDNELTEYTSFDGMPIGEMDTEEDPLGCGKIGLDFLPVNHIIDCEIRQNRKFTVWGGCGYALPVSQAPLIKLGCKDFTLLEVIHDIFWELSFYGSTENRDKVGNNLVEVAKEMNEDKVKKSMSIEEFEERYINNADMVEENDFKCDGE